MSDIKNTSEIPLKDCVSRPNQSGIFPLRAIVDYLFGFLLCQVRWQVLQSLAQPAAVQKWAAQNPQALLVTLRLQAPQTRAGKGLTGACRSTTLTEAPRHVLLMLYSGRYSFRGRASACAEPADMRQAMPQTAHTHHME
jgi:hypothetical protein